MKILKIASIVFSIVLLTLLTQTGGIVLCISFLIHPVIDKRTSKCIYNYVLKVFVFIVLYLITVFIVVPPLARYFGRVPLPIQETKNLKPGNILTCILNRHYVKPELRNVTLQVAAQLNHQYPGATIHYLDANFPFLDSYPLLPHRSHNDGKKLDLSFQYDNRLGQIVNTIPSFTGYGFCEEPAPGEYNMPEICEKKGYRQYNLLREDSRINRLSYEFNSTRTRSLINHFISSQEIEKIFIEPHLKSRMSLTSNKVRFQGCKAVRHDDHIHIQLK